MNEIVVALIAGGVSLVGTVITVVVTNRQTIAALDKSSSLADEAIKGQISTIHAEIKALSDRVDKHNKIVERTYALESKVAVLEATKNHEN